MMYREPTCGDIGEIIEVTDYDPSPDIEDRHWIKQRLIGIEDRERFRYIAGYTMDSVEDSLLSGDYDAWDYARIPIV